MDVTFWILVCLLIIITPIALYVAVVVAMGIISMILYPIGVFLEWVGRKIGGKK